jgi:hypothetical protein
VKIRTRRRKRNMLCWRRGRSQERSWDERREEVRRGRKR